MDLARMAAVLAVVAAAGGSSAAVTTHGVKPEATTAGIHPLYNKTQYAHLDPSVPARGKLLVFLPGTDAEPGVYQEIAVTAAGLGLHAIGLMYFNSLEFNALYTNNCDDCYVQARREVLTGEDVSPLVNCDRANSIEHRLIAFLTYLGSNYPGEGWGQFLSGTNIQWSKIIVAGHSQGAGHAAFIASRTVVDRMLMFDVTDWYEPENRPASWLSGTFSNPPSSFFVFSHTNDPLFQEARQLPTWSALKLDQIAPPVFVDASNVSDVPYGCTHMFRTSVTPRDDTTNIAYHGCAVQDHHVPRMADGVTPLWKPLWTFMLVGPKQCAEDFDGDGRHDIGVYHPPSGRWHLAQSVDGTSTLEFGYRGTVPLERDFDGDGELDLCVFDPGQARWYLQQSRAGYRERVWGPVNAAAAPGDFNGDGSDDLATYTASNGLWRILCSSGATGTFNFGYAGTVPAEGDYDGDGRCDAAVYEDRTGSWYVRFSGGGVTNFQFGYRGAQAVQGDYDGDGKCDAAVYDPNTAQWYLRCSLVGFQSTQFGFAGVQPVNRDYDGDGKADIGVYHPPSGQWYLRQSHAGFRQIGFGYNGTVPLGRP